MKDKNFRSLPSELNEAFSNALKEKTNPIIIIYEDGLSTYYKEAVAKQEALEVAEDASLILFVWMGIWSSDVFEIPADRLPDIISKLNANENS